MEKINQQKIDEILDRGIIVNILPLKETFRERLLSGEKLKFYIGADPTSKALHLSHAKNYMLLEEFRKLGHEVIVLIGDFTARIGDPTDKLMARKQLTREEVVENISGWMKQIKPLMNFDDNNNPPRIVYNNDWLSKLTMEDVISLASNVTVQRMLERDMFKKRMDEEKPIHLHEFMYPLMQGYDSVALDVDVELCGTDQTFNALMGRTLLRKLSNKEKFVVAVNLMENPTTGELMSKSRGTGVFLDSSAEDMYGGIMSQPDEMIRVFLVNNTRMPLAEIEKLLASGNPRDVKMQTAKMITAIFHGEEKALEAENTFVTKFQKKDTPDDVKEVSIGKNEETLFGIVKMCTPDQSSSDIRRLIIQGAIKIDGDAEKDLDKIVQLSKEGLMLKVGKRLWFKVVA